MAAFRLFLIFCHDTVGIEQKRGLILSLQGRLWQSWRNSPDNLLVFPPARAPCSWVWSRDHSVPGAVSRAMCTTWSRSPGKPTWDSVISFPPPRRLKTWNVLDGEMTRGWRLCQPGPLRDPVEQSLLQTHSEHGRILHEQKVNCVVLRH